MVFFGEARWTDKSAEHGAHGDAKPHESPWVMLGPLVVLAVLSTVGGFIQMPFSETTERLGRWLHPVVEPAEGIGEAHIDGTWADEHIYPPGDHRPRRGHRRDRRRLPRVPAQAGEGRSNRRSSRTPGTTTRPSPSSWVARDARRSRRRRGSTPTSSTAPSTAAGRTVRGAAGGVRRIQNGYVRASAGVISVGVALLLAWLVVVPRDRLMNRPGDPRLVQRASASERVARLRRRIVRGRGTQWTARSRSSPLVLVPLAGALLVMLAGKPRPDLVKLVAWLTAIVTGGAQPVAARRLRHRRGWLPVRVPARVDRALGDLLVPRRRRHLAAARRAHRNPVPAGVLHDRIRTTTRSRTSPGCSCSRPG